MKEYNKNVFVIIHAKDKKKELGNCVLKLPKRGRSLVDAFTVRSMLGK
jgi:hypothetical protein